MFLRESGWERNRPTGRPRILGLVPKFSAFVDVLASPAEAFAVASDLPGHHAWAADDIVITQEVPGSFRSTAVAKGRTFHASIKVEEHENPSIFRFVARDVTGTYRHTFLMVESGDRTRVTRTIELVDSTLRQQVFFWLVLLPVRKPALDESMRRLADILVTKSHET